MTNLCRWFHDDVLSIPSSYQFTLKVNINVRWFHFLKIGYLVVLAVIMFLVYWTGGWNYKEIGVSSVIIKVKGAALSDGIIWDATDYVYPPQEVKAFFITTKAVITKQLQGTCPDINQKESCFNDSQCGDRQISGNGIKTGKCDKKTARCLIIAWCPEEDRKSNVTKVTHIKEAANFTVYVRDFEEFIKFNISRSNDPNSEKSSKNCLFHPKKDPTCPTFKIADILRESNVNFNDVKDSGGIFQFYIKWRCFFNWNSLPCSPNYSFKRIAKDNSGKFSGYRMKYALYQDINGVKHRELIKVYGLRFLIMIKSKGEQFRVTSFLSSVGSYLSYFGIWTFITGLLCAMFLVDKKDFLTLDESAMEKIVRVRKEEDDMNFQKLEMKEMARKNDDETSNQKDALMSHC